MKKVFSNDELDQFRLVKAIHSFKPVDDLRNRQCGQAYDDNAIQQWQALVRAADTIVNIDVLNDNFSWWCNEGLTRNEEKLINNT